MKRVMLYVVFVFFLAVLAFVFAVGQTSKEVPEELLRWRALQENSSAVVEEKHYDAEYCITCPIESKEAEKDTTDPLHKWRCVECERVCGEIVENEEN